MELETFGAEPEENKHLTSRRDKKTVGVLLFLGIERLSVCRAERARESVCVCKSTNRRVRVSTEENIWNTETPSAASTPNKHAYI